MGAKRVPKGRHFGSQNGPKIDPKLRCNFKSEKVTSWSRLGSILARFPIRLGVNNVDFHLFLKVFVKINVFDKDLYPSAIWNQKWSKKGAKMVPKTDQKSIQEYDVFFDRFLSGLGARYRGTTARDTASRSRGGGRGRHESLPLKA